MTFPGLEITILKFHDFSRFSMTVRTLCAAGQTWTGRAAEVAPSTPPHYYGHVFSPRGSGPPAERRVSQWDVCGNISIGLIDG